MCVFAVSLSGRREVTAMSDSSKMVEKEQV